MAVLIDPRRGLLEVLVAGTLVFGAVHAASAPTESQVKAAYLYNFARYVTWPEKAFASPQDPIRICVVGDPDFLAVLASVVADKQVGERLVTPEARVDADAAGNCHIVYLSSAHAGSVSHLSTRSVFTVSEEQGFARRGGIANFLVVDNRVRFEINADAAQRAGLQVSSRLLRLAQLVE